MRCYLQRGVRPALSLISLSLLVFTLWAPSARSMPVFINELHYDNVGADVGEAVELAGPAGASLQGWRLWFYNGSNGSSYGSLPLSGIFADLQNGYGVLDFAYAGIQNGAPDGIALVDAANQVRQFISYEGAFMALSGVAVNMLSQDVGLSESTQTPVGDSLQLAGTGAGFADFQWRSGASSFGAINGQQRFANQPVVQGNVPVGSSGLLVALGLVGMIWRRVGRK